MPTKEIIVNNNRYQIICKEGQEDYLNMLADTLNARLETLKKNFDGKCSELTLMVLIALDLEDQLHESKDECKKTFDHVMMRIRKIVTQIEKM